MLEANLEHINSVIKIYDSSKELHIFEGMRKTLPADAFPSFEIEPTGGSNQWATTRAQRPRFTFNCTLTIKNNNAQYGVEYISTVATTIAEVMTNPMNLQLRVMNEVRWEPHTDAVVNTYIIDSLVESITYNSMQEGTIRICEMECFALIHEPFLQKDFSTFFVNAPSAVTTRPVEIVVPE